MQEASKDEISVKDVGWKSLGPVINFILTGELELGDLSWAGPTIQTSSLSTS